MDVLLEELDRKEEELAEVRMENEACLEYETMVEEMAQEILRKEEEIDKLEKNVKSLEDILTILDPNIHLGCLGINLLLKMAENTLFTFMEI